MLRLREWLRGDWTPPAWYTALAAAGMAVTLLVSLVGCGNNFDSPPTGKVVSRKAVLIKDVMYRSLRVTPDGGGPAEKVNVSRRVYDACPVGAAWPACRDEAK